ncbi:hypothetical protein M758_12G006600 [Ceratodon purpureus]|nr:hypothetical protein M758_12G006600 [Ceratodon purpureus]
MSHFPSSSLPAFSLSLWPQPRARPMAVGVGVGVPGCAPSLLMQSQSAFVGSAFRFPWPWAWLTHLLHKNTLAPQDSVVVVCSTTQNSSLAIIPTLHPRPSLAKPLHSPPPLPSPPLPSGVCTLRSYHCNVLTYSLSLSPSLSLTLSLAAGGRTTTHTNAYQGTRTHQDGHGRASRSETLPLAI